MAPTVLVELAGQKESKKCTLTQVMGKSRKYLKSYATGFVPDFRHAVAETLGGESEGLELRVVEGLSCAPKMKYPSLDVDGCDSFGVPFQLLGLSKMSRSERKNLKRRLKWELDEVRKLQKRAPNMNSNITATAALPSYGDIRSSSEGQKRPLLERQHSSLEATTPHSKKHLPPKPNSSKTKRSVSGRNAESDKPSAPVTPSYGALMKQCESVLGRLLSHKFGPFFDKPVDVVKWNIPDYFTIIKHPMDLGTVKSKLGSGKYSSPKDFAADVRLTFSNAMTYNPPGNDVHIMADLLNKYFETRWKPIEKKIPAIDNVPSEPSKPTTCVQTEIADPIPRLKKQKITPKDTKVKPKCIDRIMTDEEKQKMSLELEALLAEDESPETIIDFLKEQSHNSGQTNDDEIEIDIDALGNDTLFKLRKLLDDYVMEKQKIHAATEPCEIKLANESGFHNLPVQQCNEPVEEDIDIVGGNDPPLSSYPPVEIDVTNKDSKSSSSSSSSSDSGSSSSDSGSSADSEPDIPKASAPFTPSKEKLGPGLSLDQKNGDLGNSETGIDSMNAVGHVEPSSLINPVINEPESHQEGESAPSKRQVSPDKLYRAALLRSRFADTILKAQEKALEKGEKQDPEKLRMEREELERRKKEEKARLKAEAKAAEEAQRKAEAKAAAEAKRRRELEREEARQALQKMEKTVDINESSQFLEDLEMLSGVQDEPLISFAEESSPDRPQNGLGSFKRQGSFNPLEQLGLYMKVDDEDEEEEPPKNEAGPTDDVEEGEID
ncbi:transcription factor GTE10-like isoform X2 [Lotus japonicus]|uniref:transcription factor GTE10-like isoform X2 n=1 Tax=Lotus japonicus TaxID=34305 RepID=UPI00258F660B|nr:transcription factor GTE10-like isoform X2 [Lotus japonicus]